MMKMIVGLGNPGKKYDKTRHNTGFMVMDKILEKLKISLDKEKFNALYTIYSLNEEKIIFVKPLTYMNLSGQAVKAFKDYYDIPIENILIIHDDLDLPIGKIRLREKGSCGGQNGMRNIIDLLGTNEIKRIRLGISKDKNIDTVDFVLSKIKKEELDLFNESLDKASDAAIFYMSNPFALTMNRFNV